MAFHHTVVANVIHRSVIFRFFFFFFWGGGGRETLSLYSAIFMYVEIHEYIISNVKTSTITIASIRLTEKSIGG